MSTVRTRKRGKTFSYNFDAGKTPEGKRRMIEKGGFATKQEAYEAGVVAFNEWKYGKIGRVNGRIFLRDYLAQWLEMRRGEIAPTTFEQYGYRIKVINSLLGHIALQDLRARDVDMMVKELYKQGRAHKTLYSTKKILSLALDYAVYPGEIIGVNPAKAISIPKNAPTDVVKRYVVREEQLKELLTYAPFGHHYFIPVIMAWHTGMRKGEVLGLTWDHVDLDACKLYVVQQLNYCNSKHYHFAEPKTKSSVREILLDRNLVTLLRRWRKRQIENELRAGDGYMYVYEDSERQIYQIPKFAGNLAKDMKRQKLVCTMENGGIIKRGYGKFLTEHGLNSHSLRHTHATLLIEEGAIPKGVAARLGHKDVAITQNLYTHNTDGMQRDTISVFERILPKDM